MSIPGRNVRHQDERWRVRPGAPQALGFGSAGGVAAPPKVARDAMRREADMAVMLLRTGLEAALGELADCPRLE